MKILLRSILLLLLHGSSLLLSQEVGLPFMRHYPPKEYDNTPQVWGAIQGDDGMMYFGMTNGGGISEYDGKYWRTIDIPNKTTVFSFAKDRNSLIYVGAIDDFGYLGFDSLGKKSFNSLRELITDPGIKFRAVWQTGIVNDTVYFFSVDALFRYVPGPNPSVRAFLPETGTQFNVLFEYEQCAYTLVSGRGIFRIDADTLVPITDFYKDKPFRTAVIAGSDSIIIPTRRNGIFFFRPSTGVSSPFLIHNQTDVSDLNWYSSILLQERSIALSSFGKGVFHIANDGMVLSHWNEQNVLPANSVYSMYLSGDNLWFMTEQGISKGEANPAWSYWDKKNGLHGSVMDILRHRGTLYAATYSGIFVLGKNSLMSPVEGIPQGQCWSLLEFQIPGSSSILLAGTPGGIYEIRNSTSRLVRKGYYGLAMHQSRVDWRRVYIVDDPILVSLRYENGTWKEEGAIAGVRDNIRRIEEDENGNLWLGTYNAGVVHVVMDRSSITAPKQIRRYTQDHGLPSPTTVYPTQLNGTVVFTTEQGLYVFDAAADSFIFDTRLDDRFRSMNIGTISQLHDGAILVVPRTNKQYDPGILVPNSVGGTFWNYRPFRRLERMEFNASYEDVNGAVWIGSSDGLFRYDRTRDIMNYDEGFSTILRSITIGQDSVVWIGPTTSITTLSYNNNDLMFRVAAPFFDDEAKTQFRFQLEGYDADWSSWTPNSVATYTNLDEGRYTFRAKAMNLYDTESSTASFSFHILPPWYRSIWAYLSYIIILGISLAVFDTWNKKRLKQQHDTLHEEEKLRQQQFSRQLIEHQEEERRRISREMHDGVGQDLLILKHNLELKVRDTSLPNEMRKIFEEQSAATSNILAEVRSISHALRPPELDRLGVSETVRVILQKIRNTKGFSITGEIDDIDGFFHADDEINIVRIVQESLNNIMKHASATKVTVLLIRQDDRVALTIADNGVGMTQTAVKSYGLGLSDIKERVQLLNGIMEITSSHGRGTTLRFHFSRMAPHA